MDVLKRIARSTLAKVGYRIQRINGESDFVLWARQEEFLRVCEAVKPYTFLTMDRLFMLWQYARAARTLEGDTAEIGVYRGGSAKLIAEAFAGSDKVLHLFDTFAGMPDVTPELDGDYRTGDFADTSLEAVRRLFAANDPVRWHAGIFPATAGPVWDRRFCFVYIDVDIYRSTVDCLEFFYPRLVPCGCIMLDDYQSIKAPGVKQAVMEFLRGKPEAPIVTAKGQCVIVKRPS